MRTETAKPQVDQVTWKRRSLASGCFNLGLCWKKRAYLL